MSDIAGWVAAAATVIAAMMTAANLGSRVTGYGFIVFVVGSLCWTVVGLTSNQMSLVATNAFLTAVNLIGVWRWLGRQAKFDDGGNHAAQRSAAAHVPTLFSTAALSGSQVVGYDGDVIGTVVDAMARCDGSGFAYVVVCEGGIAGVGERLHAIDPRQLAFSKGQVKTNLTLAGLSSLPTLQADSWPESLDAANMVQSQVQSRVVSFNPTPPRLIH